MLRAAPLRFRTGAGRVSLRKSLNNFLIFCIAAMVIDVAGLIWGGIFMFRQLKESPLVSASITNEGAVVSFVVLLLFQSVLALWYLLSFLKSDRLSLIGMFAITLPLCLFTSYVATPPLNLLAYFSLQFSFLTALFCWLENNENERLRLREREESL